MCRLVLTPCLLRCVYQPVQSQAETFRFTQKVNINKRPADPRVTSVVCYAFLVFLSDFVFYLGRRVIASRLLNCLLTRRTMSSTMTENLSVMRSNASSVTAETLDSITSATTFDFCTDLEDSSQDPEGPTLPDLPRLFPYTVNKKRNHEEYLASSSDAPLFSSDDLPASSAENYIEPRVKRQHQRPWYEKDQGSSGVSVHSSMKEARMKKPFQRTYDSGVWLGSDESIENEDIDRQDAVRKALRVMETGGSIDGDDELWHEDEEVLDISDDSHGNTQTLEEKLQQALVKRALQLTEDPGGFEGPVFPYWQKQPNYLSGFHLVQAQAQQKVALCVDEGAEVVDLSYAFP